MDLTSEEVEDLKRAAYLGSLLGPLFLVRLVAKVHTDEDDPYKTVTIREGILHGSLESMPKRLIDHFPVLEKLLWDKQLTSKVIAGLVQAKLQPQDMETKLESVWDPVVMPDAPLSADDLLRAGKEAVDVLRGYAQECGDRDGRIRIYTDGACRNPGPGGIGIVWIVDGETTEAAEPIASKTTNSYAELHAIERALEGLEGEERSRPIVLYTDSQYAVEVLVGGARARVHIETIGRIQKALKQLDIQIVKIPGHEQIWANERADELAKQAMREEEG